VQRKARTVPDPGLLEFLQITPDLLAIGTYRPGDYPQLKCLFKSDGVVVITERQATPPVRSLGLTEHNRAQAESVLEAQEFLVGTTGRLDRDGFQIRQPDTGKGYAMSVDGMFMFNDVGTCRRVWIRWDGVYFFDTNGSLLRKLTANGVEERFNNDSRLEAFLARTKK
jgi:hypothetical protein